MAELSFTGDCSGAPYTDADEEKINRSTPAVTQACNKAIVAAVLPA
ncbi:MAG: hypothetical protein R3C40_07735 [Parvularculaceae bacterium]